MFFLVVCFRNVFILISDCWQSFFMHFGYGFYWRLLCKRVVLFMIVHFVNYEMGLLIIHIQFVQHKIRRKKWMNSNCIPDMNCALDCTNFRLFIWKIEIYRAKQNLMMVYHRAHWRILLYSLFIVLYFLFYLIFCFILGREINFCAKRYSFEMVFEDVPFEL